MTVTVTTEQKEAHTKALEMEKAVNDGLISHPRLELTDIGSVGFLLWQFEFENSPEKIAVGAPMYDSKWVFPTIFGAAKLGENPLSHEEAIAFLDFVSNELL
jgi:hypothetical protein